MKRWRPSENYISKIAYWGPSRKPAIREETPSLNSGLRRSLQGEARFGCITYMEQERRMVHCGLVPLFVVEERTAVPSLYGAGVSVSEG